MFRSGFVNQSKRAVSVVNKAHVHVEARLEKLGYKLPALPPAPKGNYMNFRYNDCCRWMLFVLVLIGHVYCNQYN
jgi:hypothetical protein